MADFLLYLLRVIVGVGVAAVVVHDNSGVHTLGGHSLLLLLLRDRRDDNMVVAVADGKDESSSWEALVP